MGKFDKYEFTVSDGHKDYPCRTTYSLEYDEDDKTYYVYAHLSDLDTEGYASRTMPFKASSDEEAIRIFKSFKEFAKHGCPSTGSHGIVWWGASIRKDGTLYSDDDEHFGALQYHSNIHIPFFNMDR